MSPPVVENRFRPCEALWGHGHLFPAAGDYFVAVLLAVMFGVLRDICYLYLILLHSIR